MIDAKQLADEIYEQATDPTRDRVGDISLNATAVLAILIGKGICTWDEFFKEKAIIATLMDQVQAEIRGRYEAEQRGK